MSLFIKTCIKCKQPYSTTEFYKDKTRYDGLNNKCKLCCKRQSKKYYSEHTNECKQKFKPYNQQRYLDNKIKIKQQTVQYKKNRRKKDISFKLLDNCRRRLNYALKGNPKSTNSIKLLSCTGEQLKLHLESLWLPEMSWNNYGNGMNKWNIDHIIPCAKFNMVDPEQQKKCFHFSNLQPMWQKDNLTKSNKVIF